jgi:type I restriction enzyme M protein
MIKVDDDSHIESQVKWIKSYSVKSGDLVASSRGPFKCAVFEADLPPAIISGNLLVIRLKSDYDPYVLKYFLDSPLGMKMILSIQTGTTSTIINPNNLNSLLIPDIGMEKQKEISKAIVEFQTTYTKMISETEEYKEKQVSDIYSDMNINLRSRRLIFK